MVDLTELTTFPAVDGFLKCLGINVIYGLRKTVAKKAERDPDWVPLEEAVAAWFRNPGNDDELRYRAQVELYTYAYDVIPCCDVYRAGAVVCKLPLGAGIDGQEEAQVQPGGGIQEKHRGH